MYWVVVSILPQGQQHPSNQWCHYQRQERGYQTVPLVYVHNPTSAEGPTYSGTLSGNQCVDTCRAIYHISVNMWLGLLLNSHHNYVDKVFTVVVARIFDMGSLCDIWYGDVGTLVHTTQCLLSISHFSPHSRKLLPPHCPYLGSRGELHVYHSSISLPIRLDGKDRNNGCKVIGYAVYIDGVRRLKVNNPIGSHVVVMGMESGTQYQIQVRCVCLCVCVCMSYAVRNVCRSGFSD